MDVNDRAEDLRQAQILADQMMQVTVGHDSQRIIFATTLILSWILCHQTEEARGDAVNLMLNMIRDGKELFKDVPALNQ